MAILNDEALLKAISSEEIGLINYHRPNLQLASIDLRLGKLLQIAVSNEPVDLLEVSMSQLSSYFTEEDIPDTGYLLKAGEYVIGSTEEVFNVPSGLCAHIYNRNSLACLGLDVSATSFINPGFSGTMPLVIHNFSKRDLTLKKGMRICQVEFSELTGKATRDYTHRHDSQALNDLYKRIIDQELNAADSGFAEKDPLSQFMHERIIKYSR